MPIPLRPFTPDDWHGFAGADRFPDGGEPLIGEWGGCLVVIAGNGATVVATMDEETGAADLYTLDQPFSSAAEAQRWADAHVEPEGEPFPFAVCGFARVGMV